MKPYSEKQVVKFLEQVQLNNGELTETERNEIKAYIEEYSKDRTDPEISVKFVFDERTDLNDITEFHSNNSGSIYLKGDITEVLSYNVNAGVTYDKINPETFVPYLFTKQWDGFHYGSSEAAYSDGINSDFSSSFFTSPEISLSLLEDRLTFSFSRIRHDWSVGSGSLFLSESARPLTAVEGSFRLSDSMYFSSLVGTCGDWSDSIAQQKMLSTHKLDYSPFDWLYLSVWESIIWGKRIEITYLNPFIFYFVAQNTVGDMDNVAMGADLALKIAPLGQWYFSVFLDEIEIGDLDKLFTLPKNQFAFYSGFDIPIPFLNFTKLNIQYTKIEPYCYTHYPQGYYFTSTALNINYTNDGENLGYYLPPNSDELLIELSSMPLSGLEASLKYQLIRHGDGSLEDGYIQGDIDSWLNYGSLSAYPDKDFLNDGIYEWIHAVTLEGGYSFKVLPVKLIGSYSFVYARNYNNVLDNTEIKNLFSIRAEIF